MRVFLAAALLLAGFVQAPAMALARNDDQAATSGDGQCHLSEKKKHRSSLLGSMIGSVTGNVVTHVGPVPLYAPTNVFATMLTDAIACRLDSHEQKQAAEATHQAVRGGVGASSSWTSESRPNVSGASTVTGQDRRADGTTCMAVNDVIIVNGEETTVAKRMCRAPGSSAYVLAA